MNTSDTARARIDAAQAQLDQLTQDNERLAELATLLEASAARARAFADYYHGAWIDDRTEVLAELGTQVGPPVLGEDPAWEVLSEREDLLHRLLRLATAQVTRHLD